jgi:hypothetical protein
MEIDTSSFDILTSLGAKLKHAVENNLELSFDDISNYYYHIAQYFLDSKELTKKQCNRLSTYYMKRLSTKNFTKTHMVPFSLIIDCENTIITSKHLNNKKKAV